VFITTYMQYLIPQRCYYIVRLYRAAAMQPPGPKNLFFVSRRTSCYGRRTTCSVSKDKVCSTMWLASKRTLVMLSLGLVL